MLFPAFLLLLFGGVQAAEWYHVRSLCLAAADGRMAGRWTSALQRRLAQLRTSRDAGLTTVEVAIITAVLLGLATALVAAITVVVNRNTSKIQ